MRGLMQIVYDNYPPALKLFKSSYESSWQPTVWYKLRRSGSSSQWLYRRSNGSVAYGKEEGRTAEWRFDPSVEKGLVGLLGRDMNRLKIETYYAANMKGHLEEMTRGDPVVYKLIPLINTSDPVIQLAGPFRESDRYKFDCRANKNAGVVVPFSNWVLSANPFWP